MHNNANKNSSRSFVVNNTACQLCNDSNCNHLYSCPQFKSLTPRERYDYIKKIRACINCLSLQHNTNICKSENRCANCKKLHHTTLCFTEKALAVASPPAQPPQYLHRRTDNNMHSPVVIGQKSTASSSLISTKPVDNNAPFCSMSANSNNTRKTNNVLLGTVLADVKRSDGTLAQIRILVDNGSQNHFVTRQACKHLGLRIVNGIGTSSQTIIGTTDVPTRLH